MHNQNTVEFIQSTIMFVITVPVGSLTPLRELFVIAKDDCILATASLYSVICFYI